MSAGRAHPIIWGGLLAALACLLTGCRPAEQDAMRPPAPPGQESAPSASAEVLTDDLGREIALGSPPERIVSLSPGNTELLLALGLADRLVGVTSYCTLPADVPEKATVGGFTNPDVEKVIALRPDVVFAERGNLAEALEALDEHGVPYIGLDPETLDDLADTTRLMARITGTEERAEELIAGWEATQAQIGQVVADVPPDARPRTLFVVSLDGLWVAGPNNHLDDMIRLCGGENVAGEAPLSWPEYSLEEIVAADPEVVFLTADHSDPDSVARTDAELVAELRREPRWARISAMESGRVCVLDADSVLRPGPRAFEALQDMARALHPDCFQAPSTDP
jgi:iron complex transport system substrate-binding protein